MKKKNIAPLIIGIIFILVGLAYLGSVIFDFKFSLFFDGWWTLFIIVPAFVSVLSQGPRSFNLCALSIGALLLLNAQDILDRKETTVAVVAAVVIFIGVALIASFFKKPKEDNYYNANVNVKIDGDGEKTSSADYYNKSNFDKTDYPTYTAVLCGLERRCNSDNLEGLKASAVMGGIDLDLRNAKVNSDITVYLTSFMGGIEIIAPPNVKIAVKKTDVLGGTTCSAASLAEDENAPLVTFDCTAVMGGIEIK